MTKSASFDDVLIFVYPGARAVEVVSGAKKTVCYSPRKRPEMTKSTSFEDVPIIMYRGSRAVEIVPEPKTVCYSPPKQPEMTK